MRKILETLKRKWADYLLEMLVITFGILGAFILNNWNINNQSDKIEQTYLLSLHMEFEKNIDILSTAISLNNEIIKGTEELLSFFDSSVFDTLSQKTISLALVQATAEEIYYNPSTGVLTEIISSGNLKLIGNHELKQKLASFGNSLEFLRHQEKEVLRHRHIIEELHVSDGNVGRMFSDVGLNFEWNSKYAKTSGSELFNSRQFENRLFLFRGTSRATNINFYNPLKEDIKTILNLIDSEIDN
jgi:hypothetical protein